MVVMAAGVAAAWVGAAAAVRSQLLMALAAAVGVAAALVAAVVAAEVVAPVVVVAAVVVHSRLGVAVVVVKDASKSMASLIVDGMSLIDLNFTTIFGHLLCLKW